MDATKHPDIIALYNTIRANPEYLDCQIDMPCVETPLHKAAFEGRTHLALEILKLKPSLWKTLNLDGLSPLDLALRNGHTSTVKRLVKHYPNMIRVQGRGGITPLHYAVETENIDILIKFLLVCPSSIKDLTLRDETALHIAVRNKKLRAFKVLLGWIHRANDNKQVARWRDEEGNTVLHLAALTNQLQVMKLLIKMVNVNDKNLEGNTALDILQPVGSIEARKFLMRAGAKEGSSLKDAANCEDYLSSRTTGIDFYIKFGAFLQLGLSGDMLNAVLVVAVLIATATYQAALTPPFGDESTLTSSLNGSSTSIHNSTQIHGAIVASKTANTISFGMAIGTCIVLTLGPWYLFFYFPLLFFSLSYALLVPEKLSFASITLLIVELIFIIGLPVMTILPWRMAKRKWQRTWKSSDYSLDEVKYCVFSSKYASKNLD